MIPFDMSIITSLPQSQMESIVLTMIPREDYYGTNTFLEIEVTSAADGNSESITVEIFLEQSGNIMGTSSPQLKLAIGKSLTHTLSVSNTDPNEAKRIYFGVSGKEATDKLAENWFSFSDKNGNTIAYG